MFLDHRPREGFTGEERMIIDDISVRLRSDGQLNFEEVSRVYSLPSAQSVVYLAEARIRVSNERSAR